MERRSRWRTSDKGGKEMWKRTMASEGEGVDKLMVFGLGINTLGGPTPVKAEVASDLES